MITLKLQQNFAIAEAKKRNEERIEGYGIHPLCERCLWECKVANAPGLTMFYCADFEGKKG